GYEEAAGSLADDPAAVERVAYAYFREEGIVETTKPAPGIPGYVLIPIDIAYGEAWEGFTAFQKQAWRDKILRVLRAAETGEGQ
ncbi:hypothetical protein LCGC14_3101850, partial [marine sediment metagenome]